MNLYGVEMEPSIYERDKPLNLFNFIFLQVIFLIPVINIVFFIPLALSRKNNTNIRNFSRASIIVNIIAAVIVLYLFKR